jgi:hypothetical protein
MPGRGFVVRSALVVGMFIRSSLNSRLKWSVQFRNQPYLSQLEGGMNAWNPC